MNRLLADHTIDLLIKFKKGEIKEEELPPTLLEKLKRVQRCYDLSKTFETAETIVSMIIQEFKVDSKTAESDYKDYPLVFGYNTVEQWESWTAITFQHHLKTLQRIELYCKQFPNNLKGIELSLKADKSISDFIKHHRREDDQSVIVPPPAITLAVFDPKLLAEGLEENVDYEVLADLQKVEGLRIYIDPPSNE